MLTVGSDKNVVTISVDTGLGKYRVYKFYATVGENETSDTLAILLANHINENLRTTLKEIRKQAYEQGWADAKGKRGKAKYFSCQLGKTNQSAW